ncbi:HEAT repeat domain-containing protein [Thermanaeromonas sp. C210]|uniref:HEAT repeat domain-containing protein n=1 Tax=Thermanaeromonas sp. C210 TaxID=2731925 RepID=UPI00155D260E|nr:HEAT repeat domain-containing protein [Thermanaeromonas sp. C210]GFN22913.1 HEAT repeat-containing PBS lyase [Thermanaeromonas sp. C210]
MLRGWWRKGREKDPRGLIEKLCRCRGRLPSSLRKALAKLGAGEGARVILECWPRLGPEVRREVKALACGKDWVGEWLQMLKGGGAKERALAAEILGVLQVDGAVALLLEALADGEEGVQMAAAAALASLKDPRCLEPLALALAEPQRIPPARVAQVMAAFGRQSIPYLLPSVRTGPEEVAVRAVEILGNLGEAEVLPVLGEGLQASSPALRAAAAQALGDTGLREAAGYLLPALGDPEPKVRAAAALSLGRLRCREARHVLEKARDDPAWEVRISAEAALKAVGQGPV